MEKYFAKVQALDKANQKRLLKIFTLADDNVAKAISKRRLRYPTTYKQDAFYKLNVTLSKDIQSILNQLKLDIESLTSEGVTKSWALANAKNDVLVNSYLANITVSESVKTSFMKVNLPALESFLNRTKAGLNLSDRVWNIVNTKKELLENYLASGISTGRSAAQMSQDIRMFENNPSNLFRRVKDYEGVLRLSKSAAMYHPGQGVYRSSYKNAMRLTRTENMIAFHTSDNTRVQKLPFVTGVRIHLSAAHPKYDICDEMVGDYPKDFLFTGWHPQCICYTTTILANKNDFKQYLKTNDTSSFNYVNSIPTPAKRYILDRKDKILEMKNKPYWFNDNFNSKFEFKKKSIKPIV